MQQDHSLGISAWIAVLLTARMPALVRGTERPNVIVIISDDQAPLSHCLRAALQPLMRTNREKTSQQYDRARELLGDCLAGQTN